MGALCAIAAGGVVFVTRVTAGPQFATTVDVVEIYASVTDSTGEPIRGLRKEQFTVLEDGERQGISTFVEADFPLAVAVAIDRSWSMAGARLASAKRGGLTLLRELQPQDESMVVAVSGRVEIVSPLSTEREPQIQALQALDPWSTTALHDAIIASIDRVQAGRGRRALVLFSDSRDRYSQATAGDVVAHARQADVMIYPVVLDRQRSPLFAELAAVSGGRSFDARDGAEAATAANVIARELRSQYLIGYVPAKARSQGVGEWRSIRVTADVAGARVRARDGYVNR
jgi:Ca-activated chloride channel family protein